MADVNAPYIFKMFDVMLARIDPGASLEPGASGGYQFTYDLMNNAQVDSFAARMVAFYGTVIKTRAELRRLLAAYDVSAYVEFVSAQVVPGAVAGESYEVNLFLKDEVRDLAASKSLLLRFRPMKADWIIVRDATVG